MRRKLYILLILFLIAASACARKREPKTVPGTWLEIPVLSTDDAGNIYTVDMTLDGVRQRNYSFRWNEFRMTADWVAYPLCSGNIGEGKRSNSFCLCPLLPEKKQPVLTKGYREGNSGWYSRGHQIPSADRLTYSANIQTFYGVNMTPQDDNLNGGVWSTLENKVRAWANRCDTLYVVSGCTYYGYDGEYVLDNVGKKVAVPTGYYKALLMKKGDAYHSCAFTFENRPYANGKLTRDMAIPVLDLEERIGMEFFPALKALTGKERYLEIKSEDPAEQSFWWK